MRKGSRVLSKDSQTNVIRRWGEPEKKQLNKLKSQFWRRIIFETRYSLDMTVKYDSLIFFPEVIKNLANT